jgi:hypothetical protein
MKAMPPLPAFCPTSVRWSLRERCKRKRKSVTIHAKQSANAAQTIREKVQEVAVEG